MMDEDEAKRRARYENDQFMKRIRRDDPQRARLYCDHAVYIGYNGLFLEKCEDCR